MCLKEQHQILLGNVICVYINHKNLTFSTLLAVQQECFTGGKLLTSSISHSTIKKARTMFLLNVSYN